MPNDARSSDVSVGGVELTSAVVGMVAVAATGIDCAGVSVTTAAKTSFCKSIIVFADNGATLLSRGSPRGLR